MKDAKVLDINFNQIRFWASEGCTDGEIAEMLDISYQVFQQYINKGKSKKKIKNYVYYRSVYKAIQSGRKAYKKKKLLLGKD